MKKVAGIGKRLRHTAPHLWTMDDELRLKLIRKRRQAAFQHLSGIESRLRLLTGMHVLRFIFRPAQRTRILAEIANQVACLRNEFDAQAVADRRTSAELQSLKEEDPTC